MITAFKLGGFMAAHAIWCVSDGATLIPIHAYATEDGERHLERLDLGELSASVEFGKKKLLANEMDAEDAVLLYDGRITIAGNKLDAIIIEFKAYFSPQSQAIVAIPYTPKQSGKFLVHRPKVLAWQNCEDFKTDDCFASFFEGVAEHEKGSAIWNKALDESK